MAFNDDAVIKISTAHFYTAPVGTAAPTDPSKPTSPWEEVGHTTMDNILSFSSEGGEKSVLGSLQNRNLRTSYSDRSNTFSFNIHQYDDAGMKLYLGSNSVDKGGRIGPADTPRPTQVAWYVCVEDGERYFDFYVPKADILGAEDLSLADTESLAFLPLQVVPLKNAGETSAWYMKPVSKLPGGAKPAPSNPGGTTGQ